LRYTLKNIGCWIDGAYGETHMMHKFMSMMMDGECKDIKGLAKEYKEWRENPETWEHMPEWIDDAIAKLQEVTDEGLVWHFDGDLLLWTEKSFEEEYA